MQEVFRSGIKASVYLYTFISFISYRVLMPHPALCQLELRVNATVQQASTVILHGINCYLAKVHLQCKMTNY
jgi:hypothetical protein